MSRRLPRSQRVMRGRGPRVSPYVQLGLFIVGLIVLLTFRDQIAEGTAGCYGHVAADGQEAASEVAEELPPALPVDPRAVKVEVRIPQRDAVDGDASGAVGAVGAVDDDAVGAAAPVGAVADDAAPPGVDPSTAAESEGPGSIEEK